ncbi:MAG TPA: hypothetical protein VK891_09215 [Euzebyales bacterium]|nr:hypothetical protein [Euzebyales bacterium]
MPDLQIERDDRYLAAERALHRAIVVLMALVVVAGALGVFGFGPLSSASRAGDGFEVSYDRFGRNGAPLTLDVTTTGSDVFVGDALLESVQIERVTPAPAAERRAAGGMAFTFAPADGGPTRVSFDLTGDAVGVVSGQIGRSPGDAMAIRIIFYP